jgi:hypothetical protein
MLKARRRGAKPAKRRVSMPGKLMDTRRVTSMAERLVKKLETAKASVKGRSRVTHKVTRVVMPRDKHKDTPRARTWASTLDITKARLQGNTKAMLGARVKDTTLDTQVVMLRAGNKALHKARAKASMPDREEAMFRGKSKATMKVNMSATTRVNTLAILEVNISVITMDTNKGAMKSMRSIKRLR